MKKILFSFFLVFGLFCGFFASAQTSDSVTTQALDTFSGAVQSAKEALPIQEIQQNIPLINNVTGQSGILGGGIGASGIWGSIDSWVSGKIGISLSEIVSTILNFFLWVLDLLMRITKAIIGIIPR